jgi:ubiquinone/menaquinone biosynthesis C-methylase UbiE
LISPEDHQAPVNEYFERDAAFWHELYGQDDVFSLTYREREARTIAEVGRLPLMVGSQVLEVGCGAGRLAITLASRGYVVEATDSTSAMIELTKRNAERAGAATRLTVNIADVHALEYPDASFDLVVALGVLPWLHSPALALREMARVVRREGYLIASVDNRGRLTHVLDPLFNPLLQPLRRRLGHGRVTGASAATTWPRTFSRQLESAGFRKQRWFTVGFGPFTFFGRWGIRGKTAVALHRRLQQLADERLPLLRSTGTQYVVVAQRL